MGEGESDCDEGAVSVSLAATGSLVEGVSESESSGDGDESDVSLVEDDESVLTVD